MLQLNQFLMLVTLRFLGCSLRDLRRNKMSQNLYNLTTDDDDNSSICTLSAVTTSCIKPAFKVKN